MKSVLTHIKNLSVFDICFRILIVLLPFTTILTVFTRERLWLSGLGFYKELLLFLMFISLTWEHVRGKLRIEWSWVDGLIFAYIVTLIAISLWTTGLPWIIYWWRYDFSFLLAFWIIYHGIGLLREKISYYLKLFVISWGIMLFLSGLLKWPLSEDVLLWFGYCGNPSNWQACDGVPPIFHGIDGANVRRFQWLLDGPNTMGAFLIFFGGIFAYYMRMKRNWYFVTGIILIGIFGMIFYTYSRSALIWGIVAVIVATLWSLRSIYKKYKTQFLVTVIIVCAILWVLSIKYAGNAGAIIGRAGSTKGHYERMITNIGRFQEHPMGQWLASSWPAYRYITAVDSKNMEEKDRFYIPESWYIQQFVEGWVIGGILFLAIMATLFFLLVGENSILWGMFAGIGVMNLFLHTFESSVLVLPLFMLIGLILWWRRIQSKNLEKQES